MKKGLTELVFILDRSGSMSGLESDTIGGYNSLLDKQKKEDGEAVATTVLFDDRYELLHDRVDLKEIQPISHKEYFVRGTTALLDAVGKTINRISYVHKHIREEDRPENVMFVITTDGMENASREYTYKNIKDMISRQKKEYNWEFIFLGANIDAEATAESIGINRDMAASFVSDSKGTELNYDVIGEAVSCMRENRSVSRDWKKRIDEDMRKRKNK
ncbi:hypothetical protein SAMN02745751_03133 [Dethiosulfatibacter aminovorans DSM 17477]|uniref:VWFA domain-containing protein n=1 Tax=Dethiosulfatibacter aminovorans DSM 17477 TaxID=1121476 RepID=A0A1M6LBZ5_9FIRM|nr:VWA domain-containing protein [Dethiosulfatibacter aminovorans]SHJ68703.1 hypothetical protein SAMN02745751_03133 [Dethiosulfatibacter aminovorans DSM 17477]